MDALITPNEEEEEMALIAEIESEMRKIHRTVEKLYQSAPHPELNDPIDKCFVNTYYMSSTLLDRGISEEIAGKDMLKSFEENLQKELECLKGDMDKMITKLNSHREQLNSLDQNIGNLTEMMKRQNNEQKPGKNIANLMRNIKLRFQKEKSDLKAIVGGLFPENFEVQDIIARVVENHFNEGADKYLQLEETDNITEQIAILRRTGLIETNPQDPLQIRLANLL